MTRFDIFHAEREKITADVKSNISAKFCVRKSKLDAMKNVSHQVCDEDISIGGEECETVEVEDCLTADSAKCRQVEEEQCETVQEEVCAQGSEQVSLQLD